MWRSICKHGIKYPVLVQRSKSSFSWNLKTGWIIAIFEWKILAQIWRNCCFYNFPSETIDHIFLNCHFTKSIRSSIPSIIEQTILSDSFMNDLSNGILKNLFKRRNEVSLTHSVSLACHHLSKKRGNIYIYILADLRQWVSCHSSGSGW